MDERTGMLAETIDDVIKCLDEVIAISRRDASRMGYFPALYRKVTVKVKEGIQNGFFDDGPRMERLDVIFANRYLEAYDQFRRGEVPTGAWRVAFEAANSWHPIVLQHLLLGMNAHINLDLGVAAARTAPGIELPGLEDDFNRINQVLAALVNEVKEELSAIWPLLRWLDWFAGTTEDIIVHFSMTKARDHAWEIAEKLAPLPPSNQVTEIADLDRQIERFGEFIWRPGPISRAAGAIIRLGERGSIPEIIDILV